MREGERFWRHVIGCLNLPVLELAYEDVVGDMRGNIASVFSYLGIELPPGELPMPETKKLPSAPKEALKAGFLNAVNDGGTVRRAS